MILELATVTKRFGTTLAVDDVSLAVEPGEFVALLGASGCGKTTTLRLIAGLEEPSAGTIRINGKDVTGLPPYRRDIGMVFQSLALFPHMTVAQNVGFGLRMRGHLAAEIDREVRTALELVRLSGFEQRLPASISGGQQQRVALARAIAARPAILLLDEPFSALDRKLREALTIEFSELLDRIGATTIFVTHDQEEAFAMSRRVAVMHAGRIRQLDTPTEVFSHPVDADVARFVGMTNLFEAIVAADGRSARTSIGTVALPTPAPPGERIAIGIRPEAIRLGPCNEVTAARFDAEVRSSVFRGRLCGLTLSIPAQPEPIEVALPPGDPLPKAGDPISCWIGAKAIHVFPHMESGNDRH